MALTQGTLVKEAGRQPPPFPFIFFKPNTTVIDHEASIVIPKIAQDDQADYEGELVGEIIPSAWHPILTTASSASSLAKTPRMYQLTKPSSMLEDTPLATTSLHENSSVTSNLLGESLNGDSPRDSTPLHLWDQYLSRRKSSQTQQSCISRPSWTVKSDKMRVFPTYCSIVNISSRT